MNTKKLIIHFSLALLLTAILLQGASQSRTAFGRETGAYAVMLQQLEHNMMHYQEKWTDTLGGKQRNVFVPWIRDHVHVMKAMKYLYPDMKSFLEFFLENQTEEGIYFDYYFPLNYGGAGNRKNIFHKRYWKVFPEDSIEMHRLPVEADLEYLLVEGVYTVWQCSGDTAFITKWLPTLVKGINYSMTDPLRWSKKHQLIKRGYTLDTWDFMQLPATREEYTKNGGNVQKGIFDIDENTPMGIMHGDNSGMYAACTQLSAMFTITGDTSAAQQWTSKAQHFRTRTNALCWNGKFYAHFIEDDPQPAYLTMDQQNTLSLSNAYDINRGLPTEQMAQSIIHTYQKLKEDQRSASFAEWYGIYPAVLPHFADYQPGSYMNGGVNTIVAGELAKAAFRHGYESYGVDILQRLMVLMKKHKGNLPVAYKPDGTVDEGIPDNWGQAAVYSALIEGLAGVSDKSSLFRTVEISPRWLAADINKASVHVVYGPSGAGISYKYEHDPVLRTIQLAINGDMHKSKVRILLPKGVTKATVSVEGKTLAAGKVTIRNSNYIIVTLPAGKINRLVAQY